MEGNYQIWKAVQSDLEKMTEFLNENEVFLKNESKRGFDLQRIDIESKKIKVHFYQIVLYFMVLWYINIYNILQNIRKH